MKTLVKFLLFIVATFPVLAQVAPTTGQPLARDAATFNINRNRVDFGSGQTLKLESGGTLSIENGALFSFGATAAADFATALGIGSGTRTFADLAARNAATPGFTGQLGIQTDNGSLWRSTSGTAGAWSGAFSATGLSLGDGTVSLPSLSFSADPDTGFYRVGANEIGVSLGGVQSAKFAADNLTLYGINFFDALDCSINFDDSALTFQVGGANQVTIANGAVTVLDDLTVNGTFTASEVGRLLLSTAGTLGAPAIARTADSNTGLHWFAADNLYIVAGGALSASFTAGNVYTDALSLGTPLAVTYGGTGGTTAAEAREGIAAHSREIAIYSHTTADGTSGGTTTAGSWQTRTVTTEDYDVGNLGTIASNTITLAAGTYRVRGIFQWGAPGHIATRLFNVTTSAVAIQGLAQNIVAGSAGMTELGGVITVTAGTQVRVEYWVATGTATTGMGVASSFAGGSEVFGQITFVRE